MSATNSPSWSWSPRRGKKFHPSTSLFLPFFSIVFVVPFSLIAIFTPSFVRSSVRCFVYLFSSLFLPHCFLPGIVFLILFLFITCLLYVIATMLRFFATSVVVVVVVVFLLSCGEEWGKICYPLSPRPFFSFLVKTP